MSTEEVQFFQRHLVSLISIKEFADSFDQLCFQMERLWYYLFRCSKSEAAWWFGECAGKTLGIKTFNKACRDLAGAMKADQIENDRAEKLLALCASIRECYGVLAGKKKAGGATDEDDAVYRSMLNGEHHAVAASGLIRSIVYDLQPHLR